MSYNRWSTSANRYDLELYHYGVKGMRWGVRRYQPYSQVPRKSGKSGKFVGEKPGYRTGPIVTDRTYSGGNASSYRKGPISKYNLPQNHPNGSLHNKLYNTDEKYRKNYDDAESLRKEYRDAVEREINHEQKVLNGDFGFTDEKTGKNPKSLDDAFAEWDRLSDITQDKYSAIADHYEQLTDYLIDKVSKDKSLRNPPTAEDEARSVIEIDRVKESFKKQFGKELTEETANNVSKFAFKKSIFTGKNVRDNKQYAKKKKFESFLADRTAVQFPDSYAKAVKERDNFNKRVKRDEYGEIRNKAAREKAVQLNRAIDKEAYRMLGLDESKLDTMARMYIPEAVSEEYRKRNGA